MFIFSSSLDSGEAIVTPRGIYFNDNYYSCTFAIKEGWYEKSHLMNSWSIPIYYDPKNQEMILISNSLGSLLIANKVELSDTELVDPVLIVEYFEKFIKLKKYYKNKRKKRW
ncbi:hypothetical protein O9H85_18310 [Paenibacillus filicis]|uniref:Uncharacterized protein n=1 Tax=Paenibacillus gyeongsangnamensis TaxID=3388067 RepID=A0ABT4QC48_9BACL|nr:hypothetical protein [Paenibacillus filicis]MCZ8514342.1 hypothetical protein [Paenibacillus filicis]